MNVAILAWRNLKRRPARTALLAASIALAVATALALLALSRGIQASVQEGLNERGADLTVAQKGASDVFSGFLDETIIPKVQAVPGVAGVSGELVMFAPVDDGHDALTFAWAPSSYLWKEVPIAEGRLPAPGERGFVLLGASLASTLGKKPGDTVAVFDKAFAVAGITGYQASVNRNMVLMALADLQELAFRAGQVTVLQLLLDKTLPADRVEAVRVEIGKLANVSVDPTDQRLARDRNLEIFNAVSTAISIIALVMAGLSVLNALLMSVQERMRETGIMMAIGWSDRRIMATIVAEGAVVGAIGCLAGVPLGYLACLLFNRLPAIGDFVTFQPSASVILPCVAGGLALSVAGSLYPAWRAVSRMPADALRRA